MQIVLQFLGSFVHLATNLRRIIKRSSRVQWLFLFSFAFIKLPNLFVFLYDGCVSLSFLFGLFNVSPPHFLDLVKRSLSSSQRRRKYVRMKVLLWCISTTSACGFENSTNCSSRFVLFHILLPIVAGSKVIIIWKIFEIASWFTLGLHGVQIPSSLQHTCRASYHFFYWTWDPSCLNFSLWSSASISDFVVFSSDLDSSSTFSSV